MAEPEPEAEQQQSRGKTLTILTHSKDKSVSFAPTNIIDVDHLEPEVSEQLIDKGYIKCALGFDATSAHDVNRSIAWRARRRDEALDTKKGALLADVSTESVQIIAAQLMASHIYTMVTVSLFLGKDICLWIDCPLDAIKGAPGSRLFKTGKMWFDGLAKRRTFTGIRNGDVFFGLSPSFQAAEFKSDHVLKQWGVDLEEKILPKIGGHQPLKMLTLKLHKILQPPYNRHLREAIDEDYVPASHNDSHLDISIKVLSHIYGPSVAERFPQLFEDEVFEDVLGDLHRQPFWRETEYFDVDHKEN